MKFKLALAQIDPVLGNVQRNVEKHLAAAERAIQSGAQLVVFPELSLTGYSVKDMNWDLALNLEKDTSVVRPLIEKSRTISIIAGGIEEGPDFSIYNSAFLFEDGAVRTAHRKTYLPTYGMFEEMRYFTAGRSVKAVDTKHGRLGVVVCEDLWHPSIPYILAQDGAQLIIALVASPTRVSGNEERLQTSETNMGNHQAYARLLSAYIAFCNRVGYEDGVNFWGGSSVIAPDGTVKASAKFFDEDMIIAEIDENEVRRARRFSRHALDEDIRLTISELQRIQDARKSAE